MSCIAVVVKKGHYRKRYGIFGNRNIGFGIKIVWREFGKTPVFSKTSYIFPNRETALSFLHKLIREDVHPIHLQDIARDHFVGKVLYSSPDIFRLTKS